MIVDQLIALALSLLLELPVVLLLATALGMVPRSDLRRLVVVACAATLLTHPFAWHGFGILRPWIADFWLRGLVIESTVAIVEGLMYARLVGLTWRRGQLLGWAANATSFLLGYLILQTFRY